MSTSGTILRHEPTTSEGRVSDQHYDIIVIGAGIGGASLSALCSDSARVLLLEREDQPGYHATGRSAAAYIPSYGADNPALSALTRASLEFFSGPPVGFSGVPLLSRRGLLTLMSAETWREQSTQDEMFPGVEVVDGEFLRTRLPPLRAGFAGGGLFERDVFDIDVSALHQGFLGQLQRSGGELVSGAEVQRLERRAGMWTVHTSVARYAAPVVVNAAGAWADEIAGLAGVRRCGLTPLRRTAITVRPPEGWSVDTWPLVMSADHGFYFKPDAGALLVSPADEHPSDPCDAQPEELDVAYAVQYLEQALDISVKRVSHKWAGLRSFVADRTPVVGFDADVDGFSWLAGQGGHGIQISPALAGLAASQLLGSDVPAALADVGFDPEWVSPERSALGR